MAVTFLRGPLLALFVAALAALVWAPLSAPAAAPSWQKGPGGPEIQPFQTARFDVNGFLKIDGITVDITGEGALAPPDRSSGTYKFGPFTIETVAVRPNMFVRTKFDPEWSSEPLPPELPFYTGPIALADYIPTGPYSVSGQERIGGKVVTRWSTNLDLTAFLALADLASDLDREAEEVLKSIKATLDVSVANDDRMIYRERVLLTWITPAIEPNGDPLPSSLDVTINYTRHNQPVTIEAPVSPPQRRPTFTFPRVRALTETLIGRGERVGPLVVPGS